MTARAKTLRQMIHSGYTFVRSVEASRAASALTLDHLIQEHLEGLKAGSQREISGGQGEVVGHRASALDRLDDLERGVTDAVQFFETVGNDEDKQVEAGIKDEVPVEDQEAT